MSLLDPESILVSKDMMADEGIHTTIGYLVKEPVHEREKPYDLMYSPPPPAQQTNIKNEAKPVVIYNFRSLQSPQSFLDCGFAVVELHNHPGLTSTDFMSDANVQDSVYPSVKENLRQTFPDASEIKILHHNVSEKILF